MVHMGKLFVEQAEARAAGDDSANEAKGSPNPPRRRSRRPGLRWSKSRPSARSAWRLSAAAPWPTPAATSCSRSPAHSKVRSPRSSSRSAPLPSSWSAADNMNRFAHDAGEQSASAARDAENASQLRVSAGVSDLSKSILSIAATADQQAELGVAARGASWRGRRSHPRPGGAGREYRRRRPDPGSGLPDEHAGAQRHHRGGPGR